VPFITSFFFSYASFILSKNLSTAFISVTIFFFRFLAGIFAFEGLGDTLRLLDLEVSGLKVSSLEVLLTRSYYFYLI